MSCQVTDARDSRDAAEWPRSERDLAELRFLLGRLRLQGRPPIAADAQRLHDVLRAVVGEPRQAAGTPLREIADSWNKYEAIIENAGDLNAEEFERVFSRLERELSARHDAFKNLPHHRDRWQRRGNRRAPQPVQAAGQPPAQRVGATTASIASSATGDNPCRGLHVRQGGHDFFVLSRLIERVISIQGRLSTVHGRPVEYLAGAAYEVVFLTDQLGLTVRNDSSPTALIAIHEGGRRLCLAIDEIVGLVEEPLVSIQSILPDVTTLDGVVRLQSGGLALVPSVAQLVD